MENLAKKLISILLIIIVVLALLMGLGTVVGNMIQGMFSINNTVEVVPLENGIVGMTNGGLTPAEREQFESDSELPICNDEFRNFIIYDTDKYVCISIITEDNLGNGIQPNITFVKTHQGLIWDGAWGVTATIGRDWFSAVVDWDNVFMNAGNNPSVKVLLDPIVQSYDTGRNFWGSITFENIVTFSDFKVTFCSDFYNTWLSAVRDITGANYADSLLLYDRIHEYLMKNLLIKYFENLGANVEFNMQACNGHQNSDYDTRKECSDCMLKTMQSFNAFATYLWQQSKSTDQTAKDSIVDIGYYYNKYIPADEQVNYPISVDKQVDYNGREYYPMYECKIMANCQYRWRNIEINRNQDNIESNTRDEVIDTLPETVTEYSRLLVKLVNADDSDITMLDLTVTPVTFEFYNDDIGYYDVLVINNIVALTDYHNYCRVAVPTGEIVYYNIYSDGLVFESYSGSLTISVLKHLVEFSYTYESGYVDVQVSLAQISSVPSDSIDLATFPVRIILTGQNDEGTYQFVFNNNSLLDTVLGENIPIGNYTYTVLSEQLIFDNATGTIEVTATDRVFIWHYSIADYLHDLEFSFDVSILSESHFDLSLYASKNSANLLADKLQDNSFTTIVRIYDEDEYLMFNSQFPYYSIAEFYNIVWLNNGVLIVGIQYILQLEFRSNTDPLLSYITEPINFVYATKTCFNFTVSEVE